MYQFFNQLEELGYKLPSIYSFREKHARVLFSQWEDMALSEATLQTRYTCMQLFSTWLGKHDMLHPLGEYLRNPLAGKRTYVATEDKSWDTNGVVTDEVIEKVMSLDQHVGHQLKLIKVFGLRQKEAICFRPHICYDDKKEVIQVYQGTKGGRYRVLPVRSDEQKDVLMQCRELARRHSDHMGNPDRTLEQNQRRFRYIMEKVGVTGDDLGVTAHGLRHGYANDRYQELTGTESPLRGGSGEVFKKDSTKAARLVVAEELGHSRLRVTTAYYGSTRTGTTEAELEGSLEELAQEYLTSSPLDRHIVLIESCLSKGFGIAGAVRALAKVGVVVSEDELREWVSKLRDDSAQQNK